MNRLTIGVCVAMGLAASAPGAEPGKPYRLKAVDLKEPVLWGATVAPADGMNGLSFSFGGEDQTAADGMGHTRLVERYGLPGAWVTIKDVGIEDLRRGRFWAMPKVFGELPEMRATLKSMIAQARAFYLDGMTGGPRTGQPLDSITTNRFEMARQALAKTLSEPRKRRDDRDERFEVLVKEVEIAMGTLAREISPETIASAERTLIELEQFVDTLDGEPPPRALSPIAYDAKHKAFVLFGGDHFDYLTNDAWIFMLQGNAYVWKLRRPKTAPPPRAGHTLTAKGDGTITMSGGYTYANSTDYMGGQYVDINDGVWTFDIAKDLWSHATDKGVSPLTRTYRTGPFHPDYFLEGEKPDSAKFRAFLKAIPTNTWVKTHPPRMPQLNRDWGTAVFDSDHGLILRWSGGHCAHGGTDVLQYHIATNRWELPFPVEFPLGQLYSNTSYPEGVNFNARPWVTGHTYQSYAYDGLSKRMLFVGKTAVTHYYDPDLGDWMAERPAKPNGMAYGDCYYTLTCCETPKGVYCWTKEGRLFLHRGEQKDWVEVKLTGQKLAGSSVDNSTLAYDSKRDRLMFFRKGYGDEAAYDGRMQCVDLATSEVTTITPANAAKGAAVPYLCQIRYDGASDLMLVGGTLPPDAEGVRRTPAYDPRKSRWVGLKIAGDDPSGAKGRNVSLGLMYDDVRKLFWAVDAKSEVYVLRLEAKGADARGP